MRLLALCTVLSTAATAGETVVFVNAATDAKSGEHTLKVLRDAVMKAEPGAQKAVKSFIVLEEPTTHAPPSPKQVIAEVTRLLNEAKAAYAKSNNDLAAESIAQAEAMAMSTEPWPETFNALAELERLAGLIAIRQRDNAAADEAFRNAFLLKPELTTLDSAMGVYARNLKSKDRGQGQLFVKVDPLTAWVTIDGQKGGSGLSGMVDASTHYVAASREGYTGQIQRVRVEKGKTVNVELNLVQSGNEPDLIVARATLLAAQSDGALAVGAKKVAELTKARFVVLVRPDDAAIYDNASARLGTFTPVDPAVTAVADAIRGLTPKPLITDDEVRAAEVKRQAELEAAKPKPLLQQPLVIAAGAGAAAVVIGVVIGVVYAATRPPTIRYSVNNWCHASDCPPAN